MGLLLIVDHASTEPLRHNEQLSKAAATGEGGEVPDGGCQRRSQPPGPVPRIRREPRP